MILDAFRLTGKVALVTGAARGLGQAMAEGLAEAGADVAVLDLNPAAETRAKIEALGRRGLVLTRDLLDLTPDGAADIVRSCVAELGRLDILFNNAGIIRRSDAVDYSANDWHAVLGTNLHAPFFLAQAAARHFLALGQPGKIVNTASLMSFQGGRTVPAYAAAKSAIAGLTRALANEWAQHAINVNAIAPGWFDTDLTAGVRDDADRFRSISERIPAARWGRSDDLKGAAVFLASVASDYVHGVVLPVDGGWLGN